MKTFIQMDKNKAREMANNTIDRILTLRKERKEVLIEQAVVEANRPSFWRKLFRIAPATREEIVEKLSTRKADTFGSEFDWIEWAHLEQEETCENVIRATKYAANEYINISMRDLRRIM